MRTLMLLLFTANMIFSQEFGSWQNYSDMQYINNFVVLDNGVAAATSGGFFVFNSADSSYRKFTKSEGLKSQTITAVTEDSQGRIWIGTEEGFIHIYDKTTGTLETIRDIYATEKTQKSINDLTVKGDTVFVSTDFGLSLINSNTFIFIDTILKFGSLPAETKVNSVFIRGEIYVATDLGLAISKASATNLTAPESWQAYGKNEGLNADKIFAIDYFNGIAAATDKGLFRFDGTNWSRLFAETISVKDLSASGNNLYIVTVKDTLSNKIVSKLQKLDGSSRSILLSEIDVNYNSVKAVNDAVYIASSKGVVIFTSNGIELIKPNGMVQNSVHRIAIDKFGNLWTVSGKSPSGSGINLFDGKMWTNFNKTNTAEIASNAFYGLFPSEDGRVFFGNWGNGFLIYEEGAFTVFNAANTNLTGVKQNLNFIVITDLELDSKKNIWMTNSETASSEAINLFTADGQEYNYKVKTPITPVDAEVFTLAIDQFDTKWFNIVSAVSGAIGLYYFNDNGTYDDTNDDIWGVLNSNDGLNSNTINDIVLDKRGELWIGTSLGVNIIPNPGSPTSRISSSFPIRQQNVITIAVDPLNRKWVGTNEGVFLLSSDGTALIESFTKDNSPLPSNTVKSIAINENTGTVYFGTDFGISSYHSASVKPNKTFDNLFVYPNPVIAADNNNAKVTIDGLIKETTIKVLSVSGNLIRQIVTPGGRLAFWDCRDENGNIVPSGIYIIVAYDSEANSVAHTKIAVIRN